MLADPADTLVPVDTARRLARSLPDARLQLIEGAGHHLPRRAPGAVTEAMAAFLAAIDQRQPAITQDDPCLTGTAEAIDRRISCVIYQGWLASTCSRR